MSSTRETLGPYEVLGPLGAGGMGEVYVARDPILGRKVAIKMLPLRLANERDTLTRFTQEARSASALNHPNIVTIHEVGTQHGSPYIVMEYVEGVDLRTLVKEGALPARKILDIGCQIADGLAAAHERGIIHRDLKPENIMLTNDGFVKILDFGLAKMTSPSPDDDSEDTLQLDMPGTNPGTILGTVGYMSPEQATGRPIDFRSDQFALGAILYELATGKAAFEGETAIDTLSAILHEDPEPISHFNTRVPGVLSTLIERLLDKEPRERYASTRDLARELKSLRDRIAAEGSGLDLPRAPLIRDKKKPAMAFAAALGLALFIVGMIYMAGRKIAPEPPRPPDKRYLAVVGFKDLTGDESWRIVVDGFAETLTTRLSRFPSIQVMRPTASEQKETDIRKVARDLGANLVLSGTMMKQGERIRVTYYVADPEGHNVAGDVIDGNRTDLFGVQDDVADSVAAKLFLGPTPARPAIDPTISQAKYLEALGHLSRYDQLVSVDNAITILSQLGDSASVQAALGRAYLFKYQITRDPKWATPAREACEKALAADSQNPDVRVTYGELKRRTGHAAEAVPEFNQALKVQPNNSEAILGLAEAYKSLGRVADAEKAYRRAIDLQPNFWGGYNKLGAFYFVQGRYSDAVTMFQKVISLVPDSQRGYNNLGSAYQQMGRYEDAVRVLSQSIAREPNAQAYSNLGTCYYYLGRYPEAATSFEKAVQLSPRDFLYWRNLGDAYRWTPGQQAKMTAAYTHAIELCEAEIRVNDTEAMPQMALAVALAKTGNAARARAVMQRALELEPQNLTIMYEAAVVANLRGDQNETVTQLERALRGGYNPTDLQRDPEFTNLRKNGTLQKVLQESGQAGS